MNGNAMIQGRQAADGWFELDLQGEIDVSSAAQLHQEAVRVVESRQNVRVNCEQLQSFDAAILQILVAFRESLAAYGLSCEFSSFPEPTLVALRLTGLAGLLGGNGQPPERPAADAHVATSILCSEG